jgi:hypothetical protein
MGVAVWESDKIVGDGGTYRSGTGMSKQDLEKIMALGKQGLPIKGGMTTTENGEIAAINSSDIMSNLSGMEYTMINAEKSSLSKRASRL